MLRPKKLLLALALLVAATALGLGLWQNDRTLHAVQRTLGWIEAPHPGGRWYEFGYQHGRRQVAVTQALGQALPKVPASSDLAFALKALGAPNPPRAEYEICLEGFQDAFAGRPARYRAPDGMVEDGFPEALAGL
jgi:hypothetical protein